jgi:hypothetical protein
LSIQEYLAQFNHLSQYASEQVRTDELKKSWYVRGLDNKFVKMLAIIPDATFHEIVNATITFEEA